MVVNSRRDQPMTTTDDAAALERMARFIADATPWMDQTTPALSIEKKEVETLYEPSTYGEVTPVGARQLFDEMGLREPPQRRRQDSLQLSTTATFMDLGSGAGKLVIQAYLELRPRLKRAIGIELARSRHQSALLAKSRLTEKFPNLLVDPLGYFSLDGFTPISSTRIEFREGDLLQADLSSVTHVYVASLCFSAELMLQLEDKLWRHVGVTHNTSSLQCVATLQRFPGDRLGTPRVRYIEMSWTKPRGSPVYFYSHPFRERER